MNNISTHVEYAVLWGRVLKLMRAGVQMWYYPAAPPFYVMVVLSGTRVVRVLCIVMATPLCAAAYVGVGDATECARLRLTAPSSAYTRRCIFVIMPKRRDRAKSVSASNNDLNLR